MVMFFGPFASRVRLYCGGSHSFMFPEYIWFAQIECAILCGRVAIVSQINKRFRLFPRICVGVSEGDPDQDLNGKRWTASRPDVPDPAVRRPQHWRWAFIRRVAVYFGSMLPGVIVFLCYQEQIHFVHQSILTTMSVRNGNSTCCAK